MRIVDGKIANFQSHINRMRDTFNDAYGYCQDFDLMRDIVIPQDAKKCRIVYDKQIQSIEFSDYHPRVINSLKLVAADSALDYHLKYLDRSELTKLQSKRGDCDEVLIVKDGYITDTSYSNVVFTDGQRLVTPNTYLLPGTMRAHLLKIGAITEAPIRVEDIKRYAHITLINAMMPLNTIPFIPIDKIYS
jgi:4-amino-4-deoxychorismate lyase